MNFDPNFCRNESEVESKLIVQYLLPALGYDPSKWHQEVALGSIRLDFLALTSQVFPNAVDGSPKICVIIEAKSPKHNLDFYVRKLTYYLTKLRVVYGVLTNGKDFRIYELIHDQVALKFRCHGHEISEKIQTIQDIIGRNKLAGINQQDSERVIDSPHTVNPATNPIVRQPTNTSLPRQITTSKTSSQLKSVNSTIEAIPPKRTMKTIAIYHNKGGVGKTTTVINLAAALSKKGQRVLVIDLDSQANTTFATGLMKFVTEDEDTLKDNNIYHALISPREKYLPEIVLKGTFTHPPVDVIPSHINLIGQEATLTNRDASKTYLLKKLELVRDNYDVVLIDTPPSLNLYAKIALIACDYLIIPSDLKPFANEGLRNVKNFIEEIDEFRFLMNQPKINILGVLPSKLLTNVRYIESTLPKQESVIRERYGLPVLESRIFQREELSRSLDHSVTVGDLQIPDPRSIFDFKPDSMAAAEFEELANEITGKIGLDK